MLTLRVCAVLLTLRALLGPRSRSEMYELREMPAAVAERLRHKAAGLGTWLGPARPVPRT